MHRVVIAAGLFLATAEIARAADCPGQDVADQQGDGAFNSLTDGQPGSPLTPQVTALPSYDFAEKDFQNQFSFSGVPAKTGFFCQAQFALIIPTLNSGEGLIDFEKSVGASWQQRWFTDNGKAPTFSTLVSTQIPYDQPGKKVDLVFTAILAKSTNWGAFYLNGFVESTDGVDFDQADFGAVAGIKRIINDNLALFGDAVIYEGGAYSFELSLERDFDNGLSLGPGIALSLPGNGDYDLDISLGVNISKTFGN